MAVAIESTYVLFSHFSVAKVPSINDVCIFAGFLSNPSPCRQGFRLGLFSNYDNDFNGRPPKRLMYDVFTMG